MTLYELTQMYEEALIEAEKLVDHETGELPSDWANFLDEIQEARDLKCLNGGRLVKNIEAEDEAIMTEVNKLITRHKTLTNKAASLRTWLAGNLHPGEVIKDANTVLSWRKSTRVEIIDAAKLPDEYFKVEKRPVLSDIKLGILQGFVPADAAVMKDNLNLQIK